MTTWANEGFAAGLFKLNGPFLPPPPQGVQPPPLWGVESDVKDVFAAAGATPDIARETFDLEFASKRAAVDDYTTTSGRSSPLVPCSSRKAAGRSSSRRLRTSSGASIVAPAAPSGSLPSTS